MHVLTRLLMVLLISTFMFEIGLSATGDVFRNARRVQSSVLRGLALMLAISPLLALLVVRIFGLDGPVAASLVILSVTGVLPLASKHAKEGGYLPSAILLTLVLGALTIFTAPPMAKFLLAYAGDAVVPVGKSVAQFVLLQGVPIALGIVLQKATDRAPDVARVVRTINKVVLGLIVLLVVLPNISALAHLGWLGASATVVFSVALWLSAHAIGGPGPEDRRTLALLANAPNIALALAMARAAHAARTGTVVLLGMFLLRMIVGAVLRFAATRRGHAAHPAPA